VDGAHPPRYPEDMNALRRMGRDRAAMLAGLLAPLAVAGLLIPWRTSMLNTDAALILVAVVVAVAANGHRAAGVIAAASAAVWFDFFLTQPYERFTITRRSDLETTLLLLAVGIAVTEIAARARRHHTHLVTEAAYVTTLHTTAELIASGRPAPAVIEHVAAYLKAVLGLRACRYEEGTFLGHPPRLEPDGRLTRNGARWDLERHGLPDDEFELRVRGGGHVFGRFMLTGQPATAPGLDARLVAVALADLLGASLAHRYEPAPR
jgi:K+-sensing histidine kinase KdpD